MKNVFSIDTEEWFHANYEDNLFSNDGNNVSLIENETDKLLEIFDENNVKATFFVLGIVAEEHPALLRKIAQEGHEIASHGYGHQLVYKQTQDEFKEDVRKSKHVIEDAIGEKIVGYRAPSWSITEQSLWALDILEELEFEYTSSIFPTKNYLYGIPYAPRFKHSCEIYKKGFLKLINIPPTTYKVGNINIPFSGGAYFRLLPCSLISNFTKTINEKERQPVIFYLHPREIDCSQPHLKLNFRDNFIHYYGIKGCEKKLTEILSQYEFETMKKMLEEKINE
jgi:polysaccharide deacetylase family protein (PEP-CTERM system associated)